MGGLRLNLSEVVMTSIRFVIATAVTSLVFLRAQGLPEGEGKDLTQKACSACHELTVVTAEKHSAQQWKALVDDMVRRGAEASEAEKKLILDYLLRNFGK